MLKNCDWSMEYTSGSSDEPLEFYLDGLTNSNHFDLLLGYFSSTAIHLLSVGFATFISNGGNMRIVINHLLSETDKNAILRANDDNIRVFDLNNPKQLLSVLNDYDRHFFECLTYLISQGRVQIKVIRPKDSGGIAHYKSGVFSDGINSVSYKASCNFTLYGLSENLEELVTYLDWEDEKSRKRIDKQKKRINKYFNEIDENVDYVENTDIETVLKKSFGNKDLNELIIQEEELARRKHKSYSNPRLKSIIKRLQHEIKLKSNILNFHI